MTGAIRERVRITVAVLDGPVDAGHACFAGAALEFPLGQPAFDVDDPAARHGTHVASVLFGQPGSPVSGLAPGARGLIVPIFGGGPDGLACTQLDLARAIMVALDAGADIVNVSGGQLLPLCEPDVDLAAAIAACERRGALLVAAAGNEGGDHAHVPACVFSVLAVGAAADDGRPLALSNWGGTYACNGVLAAGHRIRGASPGGGVAERTGTSFAAPVASGAAARLLAGRRRLDAQAPACALRAVLAGRVVARDGTVLPVRAPSVIQPEKQGSTEMSADHPSSPLAASPSVLAAEFQEPQASVQGEADWPAATEDAVLASCPGKDCACGGAPKKDCGCGCGGARKAAIEAPPARVYALGQVGVDFGTESRRDSIAQFMRGKSPTNDKALLAHLGSNAGAEDVERVIWTVRLDNTPVYALQPVGAFAANAYARILHAYKLQIEKTVPLFAIPGRIAGSVRLMSGETVPVLVPVTRGLLAWDVEEAVAGFVDDFDKTLAGDAGQAEKDEHARQVRAMRDALPGLLEDFRNLITRKYRNLGIAGAERALNYAATAAFRVYQVLTEVVKSGLVMDDIAVSKSAVSRPGSDCYDVRLRLFVPANLTAPLRIFQFTVDVSDTIPVNIGEPASWSERPTR